MCAGRTCVSDATVARDLLDPGIQVTRVGVLVPAVQASGTHALPAAQGRAWCRVAIVTVRAPAESTSRVVFRSTFHCLQPRNSFHYR